MPSKKNFAVLLLGCCALVVPGLSQASFWPGAEAEVERALQGPNVQDRRSAARRIAELSPAVVRTSLEQAIGDQDREVRLIGLRTARALGQSELSFLALESLKSRDVAERVEAVRLISLEPKAEAVAALESMASDANSSVRREIAEALGRVPLEHAAAASGKLLSMLDDSEPKVRLEAAASLGRLGQSSPTLALAARLNDPDAGVRAQVALALGAIGSETAIPALEVALLDAQDSVVAAVVTTLGSFETEDAIVGLVAIAEQSPRREQGEKALEALVRLSQFPVARQHVLELLESTEHRAVLRRVLSQVRPEAIPLLSECVRTFSSDIAFDCAAALMRENGEAGPILQAQEQGRLSPSQVLEVLSGVPDRSAIVLALERISLGAGSEFRTALRYLATLQELPAEAEGPLKEALGVKGRDASDVQSIAHVLGSIRGSSGGNELVSLLEATDEGVKQAASFALTRRGASGAALEDLLLGEGAVASGALEGLAVGMTREQAEKLVDLVEAGTSGRTSAFLSVFFAMPDDLADSTLDRIWGLYRNAKGAERDALLYPLVRAGHRKLWAKLLAGQRRADKLKTAQLAWYQPRAAMLVRHLIGDSDPDVAALAALSLGRNGGAEDAKVLAKLALTGGRYVLRAAAVQGLTFLAERKQKIVVPEELFAKRYCESSHAAFRAQVTRLAATLRRPCGGRGLEDVLLRDQDPRRRRLAAALLSKISPDARALRTCRFYESRLEVANACWSSAQPERLPSQALPFRVQAVWADGRPLSLTPFAVRAPSSALGNPQGAEFGLRLMTDRAGQVVVPAAAFDAIDPDWFF